MTRSTVLFISGVGRSGTTLVERVLATDSRLAPLGELTHLWKRSLTMDELCGCGQPFSQCDFWQAVGMEAFGGWSNVDVEGTLASRAKLDRVSRIPRVLWRLGSRGYRKQVRDYGEMYSRVYAAAAKVSGSPVVIDSSKQPSASYVLRHQPDLDVRVLHCVRDSRAVAYSWTKTVKRPEAQTESFGTMTRYSPGRMSLVWLAHNAAAGASRAARLPVLTLRYEDFVADPRAAVDSIVEFCGLEPVANPALTDGQVDLSVAHTCSGNPLRFATGHLAISRDDAWRDKLPSASRRLVTALTSPLLLRYGYLRRTR